MKNRRSGPLRYAVVGLGYISQAAMLPAFRNARKNSKLTALVSGDTTKLRKLGKKYKVSNLYSYQAYDEMLQSGVADSVYIALPNTQHTEYAIRAANAGVHVLCEKPLAITELECAAMIQAAKRNNVKLMTAYRLHFEPANIAALKDIRQGKIGEPRVFNSVFTRQVKKGDIRLSHNLGGGTLWDLGIYCINAARYLFQDEPTHIQATSTGGIDARFKEVDEMTTVVLRFPNDRVAVFTSSFGAADTSAYRVIGTKGVITMEPAYDYSVPLIYELAVEGNKPIRLRSHHDQFAAELSYFSQCVLTDKNPEPSGQEGLIDARIISALYAATKTGETLPLPPLVDNQPIRNSQRRTFPPIPKPELIHASEMSR